LVQKNLQLFQSPQKLPVGTLKIIVACNQFAVQLLVLLSALPRCKLALVLLGE